jgi:hypothetical protein
MPMYLVSMNLRRADPLLPLDKLTELVRGTILPSVEALTRLQARGKVVSGGYPIGGQPVIVLLVDVNTESELYEILKGLPLWEEVEVEVKRMWALDELDEVELEEKDEAQ